ncbi:hypothetical protein [Oricola sp.]|uniref:hypothetical protein n=1 Tax=Oricola sp. TaxID=1979950 RepID=UPI003BA96972
MFKLSYIFGNPMKRQPDPIDEIRAQWINDPLSHPDIARMSVDELADLPFATHLGRKQCEDGRAI